MLKRHEYAVAGISHYWLVEPRKQVLTVLENMGVSYREAAVVRPGEVWHTDRPFVLNLDLAKVL